MKMKWIIVVIFLALVAFFVQKSKTSYEDCVLDTIKSTYDVRWRSTVLEMCKQIEEKSWFK